MFKIGDKVRFIECDPVTWAVPKENACKLKIGEIYNVCKIEPHSWHTKIYLTEFPNIPFNSVWFSEV